ncbi:hypothetical protein N752_02875 [Desulforamulus aquiferis]|nr:quinate 5-dehydrogenase [Desulforamulus aquiferis]RYD06630.1 hypothetical protein N752_02875 [Desulforamulus aquiferis]
MKKVVSVSLGSSKRDHTVNVELLGQRFEISRRGTDGDINKAIAMLQELDGMVDAIGLGGIDVYLYAGNNRYVIHDGLRLMQSVKVTPVVDGSGLKNTLEREVVRHLVQQGLIKQETKVLMVSAMDRFGMAEALTKIGCRITFGDLIFSLGIRYPIYSLEKLKSIANKLMPIVSRLPFQIIYPTGAKQDKHNSAKSAKFAKYYQDAEVIAGDYHLIRKHLPGKMNGQIIITNTTTESDVKLLKERGAGVLVTTTPEFHGRTFGTNVMEAVFVSMLGKKWGDITQEDYKQLLRQLDWSQRLPDIKRKYLSQIGKQ